MRHGPLRHPWFAAFTAGVATGSVADEVSRLALPLMVLDLTHSLAAAATLRVVQFVPYIFFGSVAGVIIDRVDKRRLLLGADLIGVLLTAAIPLSVLFNVFSLELLYALGFLLGTVEVVRGVTTDFSVVPALVDEHELTQANAVYLGADRFARVIGPVLAGLAIEAFGTANALWIAALAFLPTAAVLVRMPRHFLAAEPGERVALSVGTFAREIGDGFAFVWRSRILRAVLIFMFIGNLGGNGLQTLFLYVLNVEHGFSAATIGVIFGGIGVMSIAGSISAPALTRGRPMGRTMLGMQVVSSLMVLVMGGLRDVGMLIGAFAIRQIASSAWVVYAFTPRQREVPRELRGRANGAIRAVLIASNAASPALLSTIQSGLGTGIAYVTAGLLGLISVAVASFTALRDYDVRGPLDIVAAEEDVEMEPAAD